MFRHLRQWFIKLWHRFLGLFRKPQTINPPAPQLTDAEYEKLFFQLLTVVNSAMGEREVLRCLESLKQRSSEAEWVQWLGRFGDRLLASDAPNRELAEKMVKLGEVNGGQLTEMAGNIGRELLSRCGDEGPVSVDVCEDAKAWLKRGAEQYYAGDFNGALASFDKAIEIEPQYYQAWNNQGIVLRDLGRYEEALESYKKAIEIEPKHHYVWNGKGIVLRDLGRYEEALESHKKAIEIEPQFHYAWYGKGLVLRELGRYEEALESYKKAIEIEPQFHYAWYGKGIVLRDLGRYEEALESYKKAIEIEPQFHYAWNGKANVLRDLGRYEEALESYKKAIEIEPQYYQAWHNQGIVLNDLGRYEEALASFEKAIEIEPQFHQAWNNKGIVLRELGRYEEALASFEKAIEIEPQFHYAWNGKGCVLRDLGLYKEALESYKKAIEIEPQFHYAWNGKGCVLRDLGRYEEALESYKKAIEIEPQFHYAWNGKGLVLCENLRDYSEAIRAFNYALQLTNNQFWAAWANRGLAIYNSQGYDAAIENWNQGLQNIPAKELEGCATLHQYKGDVHYHHARFQRDRSPDLNKARNSYIDALKTLTDCPTDILGETHTPIVPPQLLPLYLKILQKLAKVCKALGNQEEFEYCLNIGDQLLEELLKNQSNQQKIRLSNKYASFNQLRVLLYAQSPKPAKQEQALNLAEKRKNLCLRWMRDGWVETETPAPSLPTGCAALYWYYTEAGIVVFILRNDLPLEVCILTSQIPQILDSSADKLVGEFEEWMKQWQENYEKQRGKKEDQTETQEWQNAMVEELEKLRKILQIDEQILPYLTGINHLILIPHRHLHLLPLEYFFHNQKFTISRLPSLQMGIDLENCPPLKPRQILNIENPTNDLAYATIESAAIKRLFPHQTLKGNEATKNQILAQLNNTNHNIFHFTGHAQHEMNQPLNSYLTLAEDDKLTLKDIFKLNLTHHHLICLSACETGLTNKENLIDEFVGLVSGFLSAGVPYIISTLWRVNEYSNMLLIVNFYQRLKDTPNIQPSLALQQAKNWLRSLTPNDEIQWYEKLAEDFKDNPKIHITLTVKIDSLKQEYATIEPTKPLYDHPYHWAGFIITGI